MQNKINIVIEPRVANIGIAVRRILPWARKRMVGPFIFLDHMGPSHFNGPGEGLDVGPHPHIGLSTLTYLFEGEIIHRDSLGIVQSILPGEVNWMTAGRGISHSERESSEARLHERTIHGLQFWIALPKESEDIDPSFHHYTKDEIPKLETNEAVIDIIAGSLFKKTSPLKTYSPLVFASVRAREHGSMSIPSNGQELAVYVVKGTVTIQGETFTEAHMAVMEKGSDIELSFSHDALFAILGGEPFPEKRFIFWNLVSSSEEKIEAAKKAWRDGTFPAIPGDPDRIPMPEDIPKGKVPVGQPL